MMISEHTSTDCDENRRIKRASSKLNYPGGHQRLVDQVSIGLPRGGCMGVRVEGEEGSLEACQQISVLTLIVRYLIYISIPVKHSARFVV